MKNEIREKIRKFEVYEITGPEGLQLIQDMAQSENKNTPGGLLRSILLIVIGLVLVFRPFGYRILSVVIGVCLLVYGINSFPGIPHVKKAAKRDSEPEKDNYSPFSGTGGTDLSTVKDVEYRKVEDDAESSSEN